MSEFALQYTVSEAEFMRAYGMHWSRHKQGSRQNLILGLLALVASPILAVTLSNFFGILLLILGIALVGIVLLRSYLHRAAFRSNPKYRNTIQANFKESGIEVTTDSAESKLDWSLFQACIDTDEFLLLYLSQKEFSIIPKSALNGRTDAFVQFVTGKINQHKSARPEQPTN